MTVCLVVVYVMENIFSYRPNLKTEIGGNGSHFKKWRTLDFYKIFQKVIAIVIDKLYVYTNLFQFDCETSNYLLM